MLTMILTLSGAAIMKSGYKERLYFGAKYEPRSPVLHGAGQSDEFSFAYYATIMGGGAQPVFYIDYTKVTRSAELQRKEVRGYARILSSFPGDMGLQIGLSFTGAGTAENVAQGAYDENLTALARSLDSLARPVFLRIGYEANGFWNGYEPDSYKNAFSHISDLMRRESDRIATVWCIHPLDNTAWDETQVTWENRPAKRSFIIATSLIDDNEKTSITSCDVTDYIRESLESGTNKIGFCITSPATTATVELHSDNFIDGYPPCLQITHDGPWWSDVPCGPVGSRSCFNHGAAHRAIGNQSKTRFRISTARQGPARGETAYDLRGQRILTGSALTEMSVFVYLLHFR